MKKRYLIVILCLGLIMITGCSSTKKKEDIAITYLNSKYGNGNWKIISKEDYIYEDNSEILFSSKYKKDGFKFLISSSYLDNESFYLYVNKENMVTDDYFLPTYYSIKYDIKYDYSENNIKDYNYDEFVVKMAYITTYHYPYNDYICTSFGEWMLKKPKCMIDSFLMESFFSPKFIQTSPKKEKILDIIPDNQRIPELSDIIELVENYYSSGRLKNKDNNDEELYDLIFKKKASEEEILTFISNHITPVDDMDILYKLEKYKN